MGTLPAKTPLMPIMAARKGVGANEHAHAHAVGARGQGKDRRGDLWAVWGQRGEQPIIASGKPNRSPRWSRRRANVGAAGSARREQQDGRDRGHSGHGQALDGRLMRTGRGMTGGRSTITLPTRLPGTASDTIPAYGRGRSAEHLHRTCMARTRFCMGPSQISVHDVRMDAVAIATAVATFAILIGLIYAIDRI